MSLLSAVSVRRSQRLSTREVQQVINKRWWLTDVNLRGDRTRTWQTRWARPLLSGFAPSTTARTPVQLVRLSVSLFHPE
jgi:hypothetical protein